jgi:hypothetical protein
MAFKPLNYEDGQLIGLPMTAATYTKGQALKATSGYYVTATAGQGTDVEAVCMENIVIGTNGDLAECISTRGVRFMADTAADTIATEVGTYVDLATATTLDTTASSDDLFYVESIQYPLIGKQVRGWFQHGTPLA